jgi:UDPglucose--hexose-1-phosphate uridylyltransferase
MSELRFHPFLDTWVITATHRQDRTFLPPDDYCPLCPTQPDSFPTEIQMPDYDIVVFENKFPSLKPVPDLPCVDSLAVSPVRPSFGRCEVICYSQDHDATFASLPLSQIRKLTRVWQHRYVALCEDPTIEYVFIFENKGKEIGVTLSHPHGQIYGYSWIPPVVRTELDAEQAHLKRTGNLLMSDWLATESGGDRLVAEIGEWLAYVPFFARYPYEVWVTTSRHVRSFAEMTERQLDDLAKILGIVTRKFDALFGFSMPYIMAIHQEPAVPGYAFNWFHIEFYPPYRTASKLKYLAGSEAGAGAFINDTLPEVTAKTLRELNVDLD